MERLKIAESDIASLKDDYKSLKDCAASCFEMDDDLDDIRVSMNGGNDVKTLLENSLNMMSLDIMSKEQGLPYDSNISSPQANSEMNR